MPVNTSRNASNEELYNFWRTFDRFMILYSEPGPSSFDQRPYRSFNATMGTLTNLIRGMYRDICENITGDHPRIYRQVPAGCNVGLIAVPRSYTMPAEYSDLLGGVSFNRQVLINPPMIIDPPMNKREGQFIRIKRNPIAGLAFDRDSWLCYPAPVGPLIIFIYFHQRYMSLGCSLANLFEIPTDEQIAKGPEAIYAYGVPPESLKEYGKLPTVFYDDEANGILVAAIPREDHFGVSLSNTIEAGKALFTNRTWLSNAHLNMLFCTGKTTGATRDTRYRWISSVCSSWHSSAWDYPQLAIQFQTQILVSY